MSLFYLGMKVLSYIDLNVFENNDIIKHLTMMVWGWNQKNVNSSLRKLTKWYYTKKGYTNPTNVEWVYM